MGKQSIMRDLVITLVVVLGIPEQAHSAPIDDREAALHGGNNAEHAALSASGNPFNLVSIDVERLFGSDVWKISSSSGALLDLSSIGRIDFTSLGNDWQNITGIEIFSSIIPLQLGTTAIDIDNITVDIINIGTTVTMDFGVGSVFTPDIYTEDGLTLAAVNTGAGPNHFDIGNFNDDDIRVPEPYTVLLIGIGLAGLGFLGRYQRCDVSGCDRKHATTWR